MEEQQSCVYRLFIKGFRIMLNVLKRKNFSVIFLSKIVVSFFKSFWHLFNVCDSVWCFYNLVNDCFIFFILTSKCQILTFKTGIMGAKCWFRSERNTFEAVWTVKMPLNMKLKAACIIVAMNTFSPPQSKWKFISLPHTEPDNHWHSLLNHILYLTRVMQKTSIL